MEFRILGPLEVCDDAGVVALGGSLPRALLAMLLLQPNQPVPVEHLTGALWGENASAGAGRTLQVYVSRLRKALDDRDRLVIGPAGYLVRVLPGELDAERFERRVTDGLEALETGQLERAASQLREALALCRGPVLAELATAWLEPAAVARLEERRLVAVEARIEAELGLGKHAELVAELQEYAAEHPWRERLHAQLMLALYRSGRQAEALAAYRDARDVLVEELGLEPGAELRELHQAVLAHDPALQNERATAASPADRRSALPAAQNRTIGRERELRFLGERLRGGSVRLLTLTGPGGVGKTRLALELARAVEAEFADGAHLVSLAAVDRAQDVSAAIVKALGIVVLAGESADQAVERYLAAKNLLLVVDNCEHVPAAAPFIGGLLGFPGIAVLATSREPLAVSAEQRYPVSPLALPEPGVSGDIAALAEVDAIALFCERARAHDPDFEFDADMADPVATICRRLDGLPLAIELAAARCRLLSPSELADRLDAALATLGVGARDAPARQQTLRATIDWSHALLTDAEQRCFAHFAVFAGGATVEAAETITSGGLDTLERLVTKSLLVRRQQANAPTRLGMLETIRAYASERFAATADAHAVRQRHCRYHLTLAQHHGSERLLKGPDGKEHLAILDADADNVHASLRWALERGDAQLALALCAALSEYWMMRDRYGEALEWINDTLRLPGAVATEARVRALCIKARALWLLGRPDEQPQVIAEAEAIARGSNDALLLWEALQLRAAREATTGDRALAQTLADEALHWASAAGDDWAIATTASTQALIASVAERRQRVERAATLLSSAGNIYRLAVLLSDAAYSALCDGQDRDAQEHIERAIPLTRRLDSPFRWMMLRGNHGTVALFTGATDEAEAAFREELELARRLVVPAITLEPLLGLAAVAAVRGHLDRAARLFGAAGVHRFGFREDAVDARLDTAFFEPARKRAGEAWEAAARDGAALSLEAAITYALEEPDGNARNGESTRTTAASSRH
jgi:predicted ATPase/DNA-binding SARP family transcriptional activator